MGNKPGVLNAVKLLRGATPTIHEAKARTELIANGGRYIRGYDPLTGKELWRFSDDNTQVKMQAPLIAHGLIYITGGYPPGRAMYAFRPGAVGDISLKPGQETNDFIAWRSSKGSPYTPTPIIYGDLFYICADNGVLTRIRREDRPAGISGTAPEFVQRLTRSGGWKALPGKSGRRCFCGEGW